MSTLLAAVESSALSTWISQSTSVLAYPTILLAHTIGLTLLVGVGLAIDLRLLGFAPQVSRIDVWQLLPVFWSGLALSVTSGVLLLAAKATTMAVNPAFWIKLACIAGAVVVLVLLRRLDAPTIRRQQALAALSMLLWFGAIAAGRTMAYTGEAATFGMILGAP